MCIHCISRPLTSSHIIVLIKEISPLHIMSCDSSTTQSSQYACQYAFNNITDPGENNEWASLDGDPKPTLTLVFDKVTTITYVDIWWRCRGVDQFSILIFKFMNWEQVVSLWIDVLGVCGSPRMIDDFVFLM